MQQQEKIKLTAKQVEQMAYTEWDDPTEHSVQGYEGWYIIADTDDGDFDGEKGAMTSFRLTLYDNENNHRGTGWGGYYTGVTGMCFNYDITFTPPKPKKPRKPAMTELEKRTIKAMIQFLVDSDYDLEGYESLTYDEAVDGIELLKTRFK